MDETYSLSAEDDRQPTETRLEIFNAVRTASKNTPYIAGPDQLIQLLYPYQPPNKSVKQIRSEYQYRLKSFYYLSNHADHFYHTIVIRKRNGQPRYLSVPDPDMKDIQRNILCYILRRYSISSFATAYYEGASLIQNARLHCGKKMVLKLDIHDFFGSITKEMVYKRVFHSGYCPPNVGMLLANLCCCHGTLPQGAPTSPALSNLVMKPFDEYISVWCIQNQILYTRYCDDMTFSGDFVPVMVIHKVQGFLKELGFALNRKKTRILPSYKRQIITGLIVNEEVHVPRSYRRKVRQELYYIRKFGLQNHLKRINDSQLVAPKRRNCRKYLNNLLGRVLYLLQINPSDPEALRYKVLIDRIRRLRYHLSDYKFSRDLYVGIFYVANGRILLHKCPLGAAAETDSALEDSYSHEKMWHFYYEKEYGADFEYYPRGRIVLDKKNKVFILYADACIMNAKSPVFSEYRDWPIIWMRDDHYHCHECASQYNQSLY